MCVCPYSVFKALTMYSVYKALTTRLSLLEVGPSLVF